jgi:uncharacterized protein YjgD (DUF1641 family)
MFEKILNLAKNNLATGETVSDAVSNAASSVVTAADFAEWENGNMSPTITSTVAVAKSLGISDPEIVVDAQAARAVSVR